MDTFKTKCNFTNNIDNRFTSFLIYNTRKLIYLICGRQLITYEISKKKNSKRNTIKLQNSQWQHIKINIFHFYYKMKII